MAISHVFALHIVLASLVASQMSVASFDAMTICASDSSADQGAPTKPHGDRRHTVCAICAFASSSATTPHGFIAPVIDRHVEAIEQVKRGPQIASDDRHDPRCSRGPPNTL